MSLSIEEMLALPDEARDEYILNGILGLRQVMLVAAPAASYKSILGMNIAHALGEGSKVFGEFPTNGPTKVALIDKEVGRYYLRKRLSLFYGGKRRPPGLVRISTPEDDESNFYLDQAHSLDPIRKEIDRAEPNVVILDCLNPMIMGDESEETFSIIERNVRKLQEDYKGLQISFIVLHHMREVATGQDPLSMYAIRGHGKLVDWAATRVMIHKKTKFKASVGALARLTSRWVLRHAPEIPRLDLTVMNDLSVQSVTTDLMTL